MPGLVGIIGISCVSIHGCRYLRSGDHDQRQRLSPRAPRHERAERVRAAGRELPSLSDVVERATDVRPVLLAVQRPRDAPPSRRVRTVQGVVPGIALHAREESRAAVGGRSPLLPRSLGHRPHVARLLDAGRRGHGSRASSIRRPTTSPSAARRSTGTMAPRTSSTESRLSLRTSPQTATRTGATKCGTSLRWLASRKSRCASSTSRSRWSRSKTRP